MNKKFDIVAHNAKSLTVQDALKFFLTTKSASYREKLRGMLLVSVAALRTKAAGLKRVPAKARTTAMVQGAQQARADAELLEKALRAA